MPGKYSPSKREPGRDSTVPFIWYASGVQSSKPSRSGALLSDALAEVLARRYCLPGGGLRIVCRPGGIILQAVEDPCNDCSRLGAGFGEASRKPRSRTASWLGADEACCGLEGLLCFEGTLSFTAFSFVLMRNALRLVS